MVSGHTNRVLMDREVRELVVNLVPSQDMDITPLQWLTFILAHKDNFEECGFYCLFCFWNELNYTKYHVVLRESISWTYLQCKKPNLLIPLPVANPLRYTASLPRQWTSLCPSDYICKL